MHRFAQVVMPLFPNGHRSDTPGAWPEKVSVLSFGPSLVFCHFRCLQFHWFSHTFGRAGFQRLVISFGFWRLGAPPLGWSKLDLFSQRPLRIHGIDQGWWENMAFIYDTLILMPFLGRSGRLSVLHWVLSGPYHLAASVFIHLFYIS